MSPQRLEDFRSLLSDEPGSAVVAYQEGPQTFSRMITRWMDGNQWPHHVMVSLATAAVGKGWLHSSQISGFRHGKVANPGPRAFAAIERLNYYIWRYQHTKQLIPNTKSSTHYAEADCITENGVPPSAGWFLEVFLGQRVPTDFETDPLLIPEYAAADFSRSLARLVRRLIAVQGRDIVEDLDRIILDYYSIRERDRVDRLHSVLMSKGTYTSDQLRLELPALTHLTASLEGPTTEAELFHAIRET